MLLATLEVSVMTKVAGAVEVVRIVDVRVDWMWGWGNDPHWEFRVNREHSLYDGQPIWEQREIDGGVFWRAEEGIAGAFFYHDPRNESGYGGSVFSVRDKRGVCHDVKGPWSSRASCVNQAFPDRDPLVEGSYRREWRNVGAHCAFKTSALMEYLRANDFQVLQSVSPKGGESLRYAVQTQYARSKIRVGWVEVSDGEVSLLPLDYKTGRPKNDRPGLNVRELT